MPLAVSSYEALPALADDSRILNLAWTLDERDWLAVDLPRIVANELIAEIESKAPYIDRYFVQDPYGDNELREAVAGFFSVDTAAIRVTAGAGVASLLHSLAYLAAEAKRVYVVGDIYPDFPVWVHALGGKCESRVSAESDVDHGANVQSTKSPVVLTERPSLIGNALTDLKEVKVLCETVSAVVVVDESYANYYPPSFSAVNLLAEVDNLVVLRGLSKAYWLGALRLAYCVTSPGLADVVRAAVPPLQASSLSLRLAKRVLQLGDITSPLRERACTSKDEMTAILSNAGVTEVVPASNYLPYLFLRSECGPDRTMLEKHEILGKRHILWSEETLEIKPLYRLSAPLAAERMSRLRRRLACQPRT